MNAFLFPDKVNSFMHVGSNFIARYFSKSSSMSLQLVELSTPPTNKSVICGAAFVFVFLILGCFWCLLLLKVSGWECEASDSLSDPDDCEEVGL